MAAQCASDSFMWAVAASCSCRSASWFSGTMAGSWKKLQFTPCPSEQLAPPFSSYYIEDTEELLADYITLKFNLWKSIEIF